VSNSERSGAAKVVVGRRGLPYRTQVHIEPGAQAREQRIVNESDTACSVGTGDVPVLATSQLFAWCEQASFEVLARYVPEGSTSVAMRVQIDHIRAASPGCTVTTIATLERVEGRRYVFVVSAIDDQNQELASGRVVRVLVEVQPFLAKACGSPQ
jgi:predicted thioesterase